jgi:hypothetical protein
MNFLLIQNADIDYLNWVFTLLVVLFPAFGLTVVLFLFYLVVNSVLSTNYFSNSSIIKRRTPTVLAGVFSILALLVCLKWEYWSSIDLIIPFLIISFLFNRKAMKNKEVSMFIKSVFGLQILVVVTSIISIFYR